MSWGWSLLLLLVSLTPATAASIQYVTTGGRVSGVSESAIAAVADYDVVTIAEAASAIVWPVPSGCTAGQAAWTRITSPGTVAVDGTGMATRTDLVWFSSTSTLQTECWQVNSWADLVQRIDEVASAGLLAVGSVPSTSRMNGQAATRCPESNNSAHCVAARAALATITISEIALDTLSDETAQLWADAQTLKTAQGW